MPSRSRRDAPVPPSQSPPAVSISQGMQWTRGRALGRGSFGTVFKALDPETLQFFAVKEAVLDDSCEKSLARLDSELKICQAFRHPHIISYLGHEYTESHLFIFLEFAAGGSMASVLAEFGPLSRATLRTATTGICEGLHYLHTREPPVVHRDIKGANVLVTQSFVAKLADFGCSKCDLSTKSFSTVGSIPWMAPEVINQEAGHGRKADIWSFGCTVIEMATAEKPWGNQAFNNMMFALNHISSSGLTPPVPESAPSHCQDLIRACTMLSQDARPDTEKLLGHSFLVKQHKGHKEKEAAPIMPMFVPCKSSVTSW